MASKRGNVDTHTASIQSSPETGKHHRFSISDKEGDEVEVAAHLSLPNERGWGWIVVTAGFFSMAIVDGIVFSYGSILYNLTKEFDVHVSLGSLINATTLFMYFSAGPVVSALINRFGFRACTMAGSILSSFSLFTCYFTEFYALFFICYGLLAGFGFCFVQMSTTLVVGFYFQKLRLLALSITFSGSCVGVMILSPANVFIVNKCNWRTVILMQSGLLGIIYFLAMNYRPLLSVSVVTTIDDVPSKSVAVLPSFRSTGVDSKQLQASKSEALFKAAANAKYPTAANITDPIIGKTTEAAPSVPKSIIKVTSKSRAAMSSKQIEQLEKIGEATKDNFTVHIEEPAKVKRKKGCGGWCCHWEEHVHEQRPLYRDDVFYDANLNNLPIYKEAATVPEGEEEKTGFTYQLAVTRAAAVSDLTEKKGFFTQSVRRVLATMLDITLLRRRSFLMVCCSGLLGYLGYLIPYLCSVDRAVSKGLDPDSCKFLVSAISVSIMVGRLSFGILGNKYDPIFLFWMCQVGSGVSLVLSNFYFALWYQYTCNIMFGIFTGTLPTLRSLLLVKLYGLEKLTNATGLLMLFCGVGGLVGSPSIIALSNLLKISVEFYLSGFFYIMAGVLLAIVPVIVKKEGAKVEIPSQVPTVVTDNLGENTKI